MLCIVWVWAHVSIMTVFSCPKNSLCSTIHPSILLPPLTTTDLFTVCQVLTFIKCPSWTHPVHSYLRGDVGSVPEPQSSEPQASLVPCTEEVCCGKLPAQVSKDGVHALVGRYFIATKCSPLPEYSENMFFFFV